MKVSCVDAIDENNQTICLNHNLSATAVRYDGKPGSVSGVGRLIAFGASGVTEKFVLL